MWTTGAPDSDATSSARVVLPDPAGPSTHTSRPVPKVGGRDSGQLQHLGGVAHQAFPHPR